MLYFCPRARHWNWKKAIKFINFNCFNSHSPSLRKKIIQLNKNHLLLSIPGCARHTNLLVHFILKIILFPQWNWKNFQYFLPMRVCDHLSNALCPKIYGFIVMEILLFFWEFSRPRNWLNRIDFWPRPGHFHCFPLFSVLKIESVQALLLIVSKPW